VKLVAGPQGNPTGRSIVELVIHEGRNRIVRRLLDHVGHPVRRLTRTAFGPVRCKGLQVGTLRELTHDELGALAEGVVLETRPDNAVARALYESLGFTVTGESGEFRTYELSLSRC
jgi:ribosomal protein S18 acetylase RimI-like enzyme